MVFDTLTAFPFFRAGVNDIFLAASTAFSLNPYGKPLTIFILPILPESKKVTFKVTVPVTQIVPFCVLGYVARGL